MKASNMQVPPVTPQPHEARRGVELMDLVRRAVEDDGLVGDDTRADVRALPGPLGCGHAPRRPVGP